jgi:hypothetical protein
MIFPSRWSSPTPVLGTERELPFPPHASPPTPSGVGSTGNSRSPQPRLEILVLDKPIDRNCLEDRVSVRTVGCCQARHSAGRWIKTQSGRQSEDRTWRRLHGYQFVTLGTISRVHVVSSARSYDGCQYRPFICRRWCSDGASASDVAVLEDLTASLTGFAGDQCGPPSLFKNPTVRACVADAHSFDQFTLGTLERTGHRIWTRSASFPRI